MKIFRLFKNFFKQDINQTAPNISFKEPPKFKILVDDDISIARKQISWRVRNMGQSEIEFILMKWYNKNESNMSIDELKKFTIEVLELEIPDLNRYFIKKEQLPENSKYLKEIVDYTYRRI